jgi:hypothetical protein
LRYKIRPLTSAKPPAQRSGARSIEGAAKLFTGANAGHLQAWQEQAQQGLSIQQFKFEFSCKAHKPKQYQFSPVALFIGAFPRISAMAEHPSL